MCMNLLSDKDLAVIELSKLYRSCQVMPQVLRPTFVRHL